MFIKDIGYFQWQGFHPTRMVTKSKPKSTQLNPTRLGQVVNVLTRFRLSLAKTIMLNFGFGPGLNSYAPNQKLDLIPDPNMVQTILVF